ncbi:unnamed protein product, partial [Polarella glacialis]
MSDDDDDEQNSEEKYGEDGEDNGESFFEDEDDDEDGDDSASIDNNPNELADSNAIVDVQDKSFNEVKFPEVVVKEVQACWNDFLSSASSREAAGEAYYAAIFDAAPSLQSLFKTPRAVMAIRLLTGIGGIVNNMGNPSALKTSVETMGFQHLDLDVTVPRVTIFRDAIIDLFEMELGERLTSKGRIGWASLLNYVGGAFIYVRVNYAERLKIIASSWATANNKIDELAGEENGSGELGASGEIEGGDASRQGSMEQKRNFGGKMANQQTGTTSGSMEDSEGRSGKKSTMKVPTTFTEMFMFNSAVMGFGSSVWMGEILESFDTIVNNVSNSYRLQEECDTLSLRMSKYKVQINLAEFKAVMLASLRSMVPKEWGSAHEVAWTWLWSNVERMLKQIMGKPKVQQKSLQRFLSGMTEDDQNYLRREIYKRFFLLAPTGQDFFKQSTTRLYWIADKVVEMTMDMYKDPRKSVELISAVGLRHVGYGVPSELFAPYVTGAVEVVRSMTTDDKAEDAFRWSISLIARMLVRTIDEGSTVVMRAINTNSAKQLHKAVACAPRGKRAMWMLNITVGTQSISPLYWAIESGSLDTANAMLADLLTIRADRDNYYYGADDLFERHADIVKRLSADAEALLPTLLDGLIWRSRVTKQGQRRVNYYIKHLITDADGKFAKALEWLVENQDPQIICHPVVVLFSDLTWGRVALRYFLFRRCWIFLSLCVFITSQSILVSLNDGPAERIAIFACRIFIYLGSMVPLFIGQTKQLIKSVKSGNFNRIGVVPIPGYLDDWKQAVNLCLVLILLAMVSQEPIFYCLAAKEQLGLFSTKCPEAAAQTKAYSALSMFAMGLYWMLVSDLTILSTRVSAFVLVCARVLPELGLFLVALAFLIVNFASSICALDLDNQDFRNIPRSALTLW